MLKRYGWSKRLLSLVAVILIAASMSSLPVSAFAQEVEPIEPVDPVEPYVDLIMIAASCNISSSGLASCYGYAETATTSYTVYLTLELQRYNNGWNTIKTWSTHGTRYAELSKNRYVSSGYYYRVVATATVYTSSGNYVESASATSPNRYY